MNIMNARERVQAAMRFEKTDRIPRYDIFLPEFAEIFLKRKNMFSSIHEDDYNTRTPILHGSKLKEQAYYELYRYYDEIDIGVVVHDQYGPYLSKAKIEKRSGTEYHERDSWGRLLLMKDDAYFNQEIEPAILVKGKEPDFDSPDDSIRQDLLAWADDSIKSRFCLVSGVLGIFNGCQHMRGEIQFLIDLAEDESYCIYLADRLADFVIRTGLNAAMYTGTKNTAFWVYDEFCSRLGTMFSPDVFERVFLPIYKKMISAWKNEGINNIILHCDGNSLQILDMLVDAGFTGLQSLAPTAGMWLPDVKKKYGNKLVLIGGMNNIETLSTGTKEEIEYEAAAIMDAAQDGGVIIGTHSIDNSNPVESYDIYDRFVKSTRNACNGFVSI